ncbi:MAG: multidrug DMT transporter permease [Microbacteriaceae bacterium]|jgi:hypothetical protein|nr:multidrug DMT transporter permease [Microbacteriaceae bacterium]
MQNVIAILVALLGSVVMAIGTQMQSSGVQESGRAQAAVDQGGFTFGQLLRLLGSKRWVFGTLLLGASILLQLSALGLAPLMVVQPVGVLGLGVTTALNARIHHLHLQRQLIGGVVMCVLGIALFLTLAALVAVDQPVSDTRLLIVCGTFLAVLCAVLGLLRVLNRRAGALGYIIGTGILYGFVSTFAKILIARWQGGTLSWISLLPAVLLVTAAVLGIWFVQDAHTSGPPDLVMAGLTVIDPIVGVLIGMIVLGEAAQVQVWMLPLFLVSGLLAVLGVVQISRHHPQNRRHATPQRGDTRDTPSE